MSKTALTIHYTDCYTNSDNKRFPDNSSELLDLFANFFLFRYLKERFEGSNASPISRNRSVI